MKKEAIHTGLGQLGVASNIIPRPKGVLVFWPGLFFDGSMWDKVIDTYLTDYSIIVIDSPGHGSSDSPEQRFSIEDCADAVKDILDHFQLSSCIMTGLSWGGFVGQSFARKYPHACDAIVLMNTCSTPPKTSEKMLFTIVPRLLSWIGVKHFEKALIDGLLSKRSAQNHLLTSKVRNHLHSLDFSTIQPVLYSVMKYREDLSGHLSDSNIECLVIYGEEDPAMDKGRTDHMLSVLPARTQAVGICAGHNVVLEAPEKTISAMNNFLQSLNLVHQ